MWIYLKYSFLSIVENNEDADLLHVRARKKGDIEAAFGGMVEGEDIKHTPTGDYKFRVDLPRHRDSSVIMGHVDEIDYTNFKNSVTDHQRHDAYMDTWTAAHGLEAGRHRRGYMDLREDFGEGEVYQLGE